MMNTDQVNQNTDAARQFTPLKEAEIHALRDAVLAAGPMMCADCDGRCGRAAGTDAAAGRPDPVPDLPRAPWFPPAGPRGLCRAHRGRAELARRRPRRPPARPARASSTSPSSCPRSIACWVDCEPLRPRTRAGGGALETPAGRFRLQRELPATSRPRCLVRVQSVVQVREQEHDGRRSLDLGIPHVDLGTTGLVR